MLGCRKDIRDYSKSHERLLIKRAASKAIIKTLCKNKQVTKKYNVLENVETAHEELFRNNGLSTSIIQNNDIDKEQYTLTTLQTTHATDSKSSKDIIFLTTKHAFLSSGIQSDDPENSEIFCSEEEDDANNKDDISDDIAAWAVHDGISHASLERLLRILRKSNRYPQLPAKANTLLGNPTNGLIRSVEPGYYWHNGLKTCLEKLSEEINSDKTLETLFLSININGIPLFKSSGSCLYPILGSIPCSQQVFLIGCYHGYKKPKDFNVFLKDFVDETIELITTGFYCRGKTYNIKIHQY